MNTSYATLLFLILPFNLFAMMDNEDKQLVVRNPNTQLVVKSMNSFKGLPPKQAITVFRKHDQMLSKVSPIDPTLKPFGVFFNEWRPKVIEYNKKQISYSQNLLTLDNLKRMPEVASEKEIIPVLSPNSDQSTLQKKLNILDNLIKVKTIALRDLDANIEAKKDQLKKQLQSFKELEDKISYDPALLVAVQYLLDEIKASFFILYSRIENGKLFLDREVTNEQKFNAINLWRNQNDGIKFLNDEAAKHKEPFTLPPINVVQEASLNNLWKDPRFPSYLHEMTMHFSDVIKLELTQMLKSQSQERSNLESFNQQRANLVRNELIKSESEASCAFDLFQKNFFQQVETAKKELPYVDIPESKEEDATQLVVKKKLRSTSVIIPEEEKQFTLVHKNQKLVANFLTEISTFKLIFFDDVQYSLSLCNIQPQYEHIDLHIQAMHDLPDTFRYHSRVASLFNVKGKEKYIVKMKKVNEKGIGFEVPSLCFTDGKSVSERADLFHMIPIELNDKLLSHGIVSKITCSSQSTKIQSPCFQISTFAKITCKNAAPILGIIETVCDQHGIVFHRWFKPITRFESEVNRQLLTSLYNTVVYSGNEDTQKFLTDDELRIIERIIS